METLRDLRSWASNIGKFSSVDDIEEVEGSIFCQTEEDADFGEIRFRWYTANNCYAITASCYPANAEKSGDRIRMVRRSPARSYLGCIASNRTPRAGEDWTRGNDLADGKLSHKTWMNILGDILSYELVKVHKKKTSGHTEESLANAPFGASSIGPSKED